MAEIIEATTPFRHSLDVQLRFTDIDMLGHLNNSIYMQFMDMAKVDFFTRLNGAPLKDWQGLNFVVANINVNFFVPTKWGEELKVLTRVAELGHKSVTLHQRVVNRQSGEVKAEALTVMVSLDVRAGRTVAIPDEWRALLTSQSPL